MASINIYTAEQLLDNFIQYLVANPSSVGPWNLNVGSRVRSIGEALILIKSINDTEFYLGINEAIKTSVLNSFGFAKLTATTSVGYVVFSRYTNVGSVSIPAGVRVTSENGLVFETQAPAAIAVGDYTSSPVLTYSSEGGVENNIIAYSIDTLNGRGSIIDTVNGVDNVVNQSVFTGGTNEETEAEQLFRFRKSIQGLTKSNIEGLIRGVLSVTGVKSVSLVESYPEPGVVTIYADDGTGNLSPLIKAEIEKVINGDPNDLTNYPGYRAAGIAIDVQAPAIIVVNMTISVYHLKNNQTVDSVTLSNLCQSAVESYINNLGIGADVILTEVISAIQNVHPDVYDVIITSPTANITVDGFYKARTGIGVGGTITINILETDGV